MAKSLLLRVDSGPRQGKTWILSDPGVYWFGRGDECFEILPNQDPLVGRRHFAVAVSATGVEVLDLGSRNGTTVNGERLPTCNEGELAGVSPKLSGGRSLQDGDSIGAGGTLFLVRLLDAIQCAGCGLTLGEGGAEVWTSGPSPRVYCGNCFEAARAEPEPAAAKVALCDYCGAVTRGPREGGVSIGGNACDACRERVAGAAVVELRMTQMASESIPRGRRKLPIESFEIQRVLGSGSASTVYLATLKAERNRVAVKVLQAPRLVDEKSRAPVVEDLRRAERIDHDRVVRLLDFAIDERVIYLVMEYCEMGDLGRLLRSRGGKIGQQETLPLLIDTLEGLAHAHSLGATHGRLKPGNVLLTRLASGRVGAKIADLWRPRVEPDRPFLDGSNHDLATPPLAAAEAVSGPLSPVQRDLWNLAATFYQALTGEPPIEAGRWVSSPSPIVPLRHRDPTILTEFAEAIDKSLGVDPSGLYSSAEEMLLDARSVLKSYVRLTLRPQ